MVYKKWPALVLFVVAFIILTISGYQCSTPHNPNSTSADEQGDVQESQAGSEGENSRESRSSNSRAGDREARSSDSSSGDIKCPRKALRRLAEREEMTKATFKFASSSAITDFRLGLSPNYDNACSRIYLDMDPVEYGGATVFEGSMTLVYVGTCADGEEGICGTRMSTGYGAEDARYNRWTAGKWKILADGSVSNKKFHAIFEDTEGQGAYILRLDYFEEADIGDGVVGYRGFGEIYSKMFRTSTVSDVHRVDKAGDCYNTGTYISMASRIPNNRPSIRCWFVNTGPYHCRPNGDLLIHAPFTNIDLTTEEYRCYRRLGTIDSIDVGRAFNTSDVTEL